MPADGTAYNASMYSGTLLDKMATRSPLPASSESAPASRNTFAFSSAKVDRKFPAMTASRSGHFAAASANNSPISTTAHSGDARGRNAFHDLTREFVRMSDHHFVTGLDGGEIVDAS